MRRKRKTVVLGNPVFIVNSWKLRLNCEGVNASKMPSPFNKELTNLSFVIFQTLCREGVKEIAKPKNPYAICYFLYSHHLPSLTITAFSCYTSLFARYFKIKVIKRFHVVNLSSLECSTMRT